MQPDDAAEKLELTQRVISLLDSWGIKDADQIGLLQLSGTVKPRMMRRFRQDTPFPDEVAVMLRIEHLLGIAEALRTTYPLSPAAGSLWMTRPSPRFDNCSPAQILVAEGLQGLIKIRSHLDCTFDWAQDAHQQGTLNG